MSNFLQMIRVVFTPGKPQPPERNAAYLKWLKRFPCVACGESRKPRDAAHLGPHGIGTKASDMFALPLCRACHQLQHASSRRFYAKMEYEVIRDLQIYFQNLWAWEQAGRPAGVDDEKRAA